MEQTFTLRVSTEPFKSLANLAQIISQILAKYHQSNIFYSLSDIKNLKYENGKSHLKYLAW